MGWLRRNWRRILTPVCTVGTAVATHLGGLEAGAAVAGLCGVLLGNDAQKLANQVKPPKPPIPPLG